MLYLGLISGTSMDAIDVALLHIDDAGERGRVELRAFGEIPYPDPLRARLERVVQSRSATIDTIGALHVALGARFADAALDLLAQARVTPSAVSALGSHGQTIGHRGAGPEAYSWQLADPHVIALRTGIRTIADFRAMDIAAGGHGAPLVPGFHRRIFRCDDRDVAVLNIGGIANVSLLRRDPDAPLLGFDCGPGNTLLDLWARRHLGTAYDAGGRWASAGRVNVDLLQQMLRDEPYFALPPPKSTGREMFHLPWLERQLTTFGRTLRPEDVQATLAQLTVSAAAAAIERYLPHCTEIIVCGGGARNDTLHRLLAATVDPLTVTTSEAHGWPAAAIEASAFAWLAARRVAGLPGNVPSVTGARTAVLLGAIFDKGDF